MSSNEGNDTIHCGSFKQPCRTLTFTIEYVTTTQGQDVIQLDGGVKAQLVYKIHRTIDVEHPFEIINTKGNEMGFIFATI